MFDDTIENAHFVRQRRNLIILSIFIMFYENAELTIKEINVLGNYVIIKNHNVVSVALVFALIYLFWRYYTSCREVEGVGRFFYACRAWAEDMCAKYVKSKYVFTSQNLYESADLISRREMKLVFCLRPTRDQRDAGKKQKEIVVGGLLWFYSVISFIPIVIRTSKFTEYLLPYIFAAVAALELLGINVIGAVFGVK